MPFSAYALNQHTIEQIQQAYRTSERPWFVAYSGGKDSSALLKLVYLALRHEKAPQRPVTAVYCDTGVEIPLMQQHAVQTLLALEDEARVDGVPVTTRLVKPPLADRYFVKVIGRGYPPPSNKFRWCTNRLRVGPVQQAIRALGHGAPATVLTGVRRGESARRDRTLAAHATDQAERFRQSSAGNVELYSPIVEYSTEQVWNTLTFNIAPRSIALEPLVRLYRDAGGECPVMLDGAGTPCANGRFGCWTCTVVSRDRAVEGMVAQGHAQLAPLLAFRNWLAAVRDESDYRCPRRRNGATSPGPFTLAARAAILDRLLDAQHRSGLPLIDAEELSAIKNLWQDDQHSEAYLRVCEGRML